MKILVDTSVWSLALRRRSAGENPYANELRELITELRVQMIGPIRQELLSGIRVVDQFFRLRDHLQAFPDLPLETADYERAATHFNTCRSRGIQGSNTDFLICALAERHKMPILTTDADFALYRKHIDLQLHQPR